MTAPEEAVEEGPRVVTGAVVRAIALPVDGEIRAAVQYDFEKPDGSGYYPPVIYVPENDVEAERAGQHIKKVHQSAVQQARLHRRVGWKITTTDEQEQTG